MRFGKRSKSPLFWGRRANREVDQAAEETVDEKSPESPVQPTREEPPPAEIATHETPVAEEPHAMTGDPTQRLLTSLGRFQRQFMKARDGAPQAQWSDECMNHLIRGVEIALEQEWSDLVEALTETGRILQTYEDAGRANDCVPFLADSYEILCLMVGDLIVDKIRSGVMRKWRDLYQVALDDLAAEGLRLVEDGDDARRAARLQAAEEPSVPAPASGGAEDAPTGDRQGWESGEEASQQLPSLTPAEEIASGAGDDSGLIGDSLYDSEEDLYASFPSSGNEEPATEMETAEVPLASTPGFSDAADATAEDTDVPGRPEPPSHSAEPESLQGLDREMVEMLDTLCDGLARIETEPPGGVSTVFLAMHEGLGSLEERARQHGWEGSVAACRAMERLCHAAAQQAGNLGDRFYEVAYAFGGIYGESKEQTNDPVLTNWVAESESVLESWAERVATRELGDPSDSAEASDMPFELPVTDEGPIDDAVGEVPSLDDTAWEAETEEAVEAESPADTSYEGLEVTEADTLRGQSGVREETGGPADGKVPPLEERPGSEYIEISSAEPSRREATEAGEVVREENAASQLLDTARQAVVSGASTDAKLFAMQAAASIARAQANDAEAKVQHAEIRLQETIKSIKSARQQVQDAEVHVTEAEAQVEEGKESLEERARHTHGVVGSLDGIQERIADLDRRIQELQAQREETVLQRRAAEEALVEAREQENDAKAQLDSLKNSEQTARVHLEDARGQVKLLQRKQAEIEAAMERARDNLTRFRESMTDIEETIELIRNAETDATGEGDELLF